MNYDIIGDVHGHADKLFALLDKMGYEKSKGIYSHPECIAVFCGDIIDKGPQQLETLDAIKSMIDAGSALAVMGNHEFNAIAWYMNLREHDEPYGKNYIQHKDFLNAVVEGSNEHIKWIDWFIKLPLWLDLPLFRVIHACWDSEQISKLKPLLRPGYRLSKGIMSRSVNEDDSIEFNAIETLLKGPELKLPYGADPFYDKVGCPRDSIRVQWWNSDATTFRSLAHIDQKDENRRQEIPDTVVADNLISRYKDDKLLFFGHYWFVGNEPTVISDKIACLDYSVAKDGLLTAYRWRQQDRALSNSNFVSVKH
ncbi:MAG: metallophosphoesterase [Fibrobacteres bacterium]|nr:metallophosphoesterase [Fibrobacterota bacterium]